MPTEEPTCAPTFDHPLKIFLLASVPLRILALRETGGPQAHDYGRIQMFFKVLAEQGDQLLFKSAVPGRTADLANGLADAIAVLSFCPGGVTLFGEHWESTCQQ
jgi:hypothetical protein